MATSRKTIAVSQDIIDEAIRAFGLKMAGGFNPLNFAEQRS